jgi:hypothetical protein
LEIQNIINVVPDLMNKVLVLVRMKHSRDDKLLVSMYWLTGEVDDGSDGLGCPSIFNLKLRWDERSRVDKTL